MFAKILIANRGEIAVRIIATARALGVKSVAVFSEADRDALHVRLADESRCIGPAAPAQSYLDIDRIIEAARGTGAEAIHPGYGFLSENADFAQAVADAGLVFIGPRAATMSQMGDKVAARSVASAADVPILPGTDGPVGDVESALAAARRIGFPVAVKANFGGGGRGMRVADSEGALASAMQSASREAEAAFGRSDIFLERYLTRPRHVEVQILGDAFGKIVHLGDRDCSVQRRHQKIVEEAPAPGLDPGLRGDIRNAALALARVVDYLGAGTVEFLVDPAERAFYFLEMNTRLQVEHGVTELVTGIDIVEAQIRIAAGLALDFDQDEVAIKGHAIEARIAAEDPGNAFLPAPGRIGTLQLPSAPWIRADFGVQTGDRVERHYDSLIGKLLAWGPDRENATRRLRAALEELAVEGVPTTASYIGGIMTQPDFVAASHFTGSVEQDWPPDPSGAVRSAPATEPQTDKAASRPERQVTIASSPPRAVTIFGEAGRSPPEPGGESVPRRPQSQPAEPSGSSPGHRVLIAPMDGLLIETRVEPGQAVAVGEPLLVLEAMKMEVVVAATAAGAVRQIHCEVGAAVRKGQVLIEIE